MLSECGDSFEPGRYACVFIFDADYTDFADYFLSAITLIEIDK
jgi:hypothetical protein